MKRPGCLIGRHPVPLPYHATRGDGIWFGECPFCMTEIMKRDGDRWREMPTGQRLVWHRGVPALVERRGSNSRSLPVVQPREGAIRRLLTKLFQR